MSVKLNKFLIIFAIMIFNGTAATAIAGQKVKADHTDRAAVNKGITLYVEHCAECHGAKLEGQPNWTRRKASGALPAPPHDPSGHTWHHSDEVLLNMTKFGPRFYAGPAYITEMPAYVSILTDEEMLSIIAFIKSTWPEEILEAQQRMQ